MTFRVVEKPWELPRSSFFVQENIVVDGKHVVGWADVSVHPTENLAIGDAVLRAAGLRVIAICEAAEPSGKQPSPT